MIPCDNNLLCSVVQHNTLSPILKFGIHLPSIQNIFSKQCLISKYLFANRVFLGDSVDRNVFHSVES